MIMRDGGAASPVSATQFARMLQFGDSMFPIGGFSFSGGLESAVQTRVVTDVPSLLEFTRTALEQAARGDGIAILCAHRAAVAGDVATLLEIDSLVFGRKLSGETRAMSTKMGRKFAEICAHVTGSAVLQDWRGRVVSGATPGCYPVALAIHFAALGLPARDAFVVHQNGVINTILGAALRLMRISHVDTQSLLFQLNADMDAHHDCAARAGLDEMAGFAPLAEILAAVHVKAHVRLFMN
jgi:urease accessory protein